MKNSTQATNAIRPVTQINPDFTHRKVVRIDSMIYPLVLTLQWELRDGNLSRDDIRELIKRAEKTFIDDSSKDSGLQARINQLEFENQSLKTKGNGLDEKLRKRLIHFCHPDKHQDKKEIATELTQALNGLGK